MDRRPAQLSPPIPPTWGGRRPGAGRKPTPGRRPNVPHCPRPGHVAAHPVHVTLRATHAVRSLRSDRVFPAVRSALAAASHAGFRIIQFSAHGSSPPDHRGRRPDAPVRWAPRPRHPRGARRQSRSRTPRRCVGRSLPCSAADHPARGPQRLGLRPPERGEARPRASRARSLLLGALVRRVARRGSGGDNRARARGEGAYLAGNDRLAAARTHQPVHRMPENPHPAVARSARFSTAGIPGSVSTFADAR